MCRWSVDEMVIRRGGSCLPILETQQAYVTRSHIDDVKSFEVDVK